jgi:hypothetical protein
LAVDPGPLAAWPACISAPSDTAIVASHDGGRPEPPEALRDELVGYDEVLQPTFAYRWPEPAQHASSWCLLGLEVPVEVDLDRKPPEGDDACWTGSPQK